MVYDQIDDALTRKAGELYDTARAKISGSRSGATQNQTSPTAPAPSSATASGRAELKDGLTPEQRRMLDELG